MRLETTYRRSVEFWKITVLELPDDWVPANTVQRVECTGTRQSRRQ